ncbi:Phage late control D protein [Desulfitobacterium hafniense]|uniref:Phage late control D protein n=1 Tax=Desulfitobacterium hafniense TaxID=49338 RepID=A0A098AXE4_DESHA|nr:contractile injection system protein, VgrG/Pvc8 family [Desulfitobacterium hafniense]CDX01304.1 Phage late control D protein [Desulfitobacterium hafniense]
MNSRWTYLDLTYNKTNITAELEGHIKDWTFTDNLSGQIDDLQITLEDVEHKWLGDWFPAKGDLIEATIYKREWKDQLTKTKIGKFEVDEIEAKGPPSDIIVKALSVPESSSLRGQEKSKAWENTTLRVVAEDIAKQNSLKLYFEASDDPKKERYEQDSETDLAFLYRLCNDEGLCLKLASGSIVILDEVDYEAKSPVATIKRVSAENDDIKVIRWQAKTTLSGTYKSARVQYTDSSTKTTITASFTPLNPPKVGRVLVIKDEVKSVAEGQKLAKKRLREANKNATTVSLTVVSERHLDAGMTVNLKEFGKFDGKYIITQAVHSQTNVALQLRKCLEGY